MENCRQSYDELHVIMEVNAFRSDSKKVTIIIDAIPNSLKSIIKFFFYAIVNC